MNTETHEREMGLSKLSRLLEEEIASYDRLIQEMKRESECLRKGSTESLVTSVKVIDGYHDAILAWDEKIKISIEEVLKSHGGEPKEPTLSHVLNILPQGDQRRIKAYQQTLRTLKNWARKINEENKSFIHEYLGYLNDLLSYVMGPRADDHGINPRIEFPVYLHRGQGRSLTPLPRALNREV